MSDLISTVADVLPTGPIDASLRPADRSHAPRTTSNDPIDLARRCGLVLQSHPRVVIQWDAVSALGGALRLAATTTGGQPYAWDDPKFWPVEADEMTRSQLLTVGNALNFRFWRKTQAGTVEAMGGDLEGERFTGSMYLWRRIRLAYDGGAPLASAKYLQSMDATRFHEIFVDDNGFNPLAEGVDERVANLRNLGDQLVERWGGEFMNLLRKADGSLPAFMRMSHQIRAYDDSLGKLSLVNALMHRGSRLVEFEEDLLPAVDYQLLKQLLRQGVLVVDDEMAAKIRGFRHLDDDEAKQLRSAALEALLAAGSEAEIPGDIVDNQLWSNRTICTDVKPGCSACPFNSFCARDDSLQRPLQITRLY